MRIENNFKMKKKTENLPMPVLLERTEGIIV